MSISVGVVGELSDSVETTELVCLLRESLERMERTKRPDLEDCLEEHRKGIR